MISEKTLVLIPTYNEQENVEKLFNEIINLDSNVDFLFIDDNSPDGTGRTIDRLAKQHTNVNVIHRPKKLGIGSAHMDGINWAYDHHYKVLITMDCDFTHLPKYIPDFIRNSGNYHVVVGSRYLSSKSIEAWSLPRRILTLMAHFLTKHLLKMEYDATGAYRLYRLGKIPQNVFRLIRSSGYSFLFESLYVLHVNRVSIKEISICLPTRNLAHSKMTIKHILQWGKYLIYIFLLTIFNRKRFKMSQDFTQNEDLKTIDNDSGWDEYWSKRSNVGGFVYDSIAALYRKYIFKRSLNHFIRKYFGDGSRLLHAGCGSGQVDADIAKLYRIISLDSSASALNLNRAITNNGTPLIRGTILNLPFSDSSFDGVYNLGVMEHFTERDINLILQEFKPIIKTDGKIILFWPPEFGLTVVFLKFVHFVLNRVLGRNLKLHPDEITLIKSREHIKTIMDRAGLKIVEQSFSGRDLFTHYVLVCEKPPKQLSKDGDGKTKA